MVPELSWLTARSLQWTKIFPRGQAQPWERQHLCLWQRYVTIRFIKMTRTKDHSMYPTQTENAKYEGNPASSAKMPIVSSYAGTILKPARTLKGQNGKPLKARLVTLQRSLGQVSYSAFCDQSVLSFNPKLSILLYKNPAWGGGGENWALFQEIKTELRSWATFSRDSRWRASKRRFGWCVDRQIDISSVIHKRDQRGRNSLPPCFNGQSKFNS